MASKPQEGFWARLRMQIWEHIKAVIATIIAGLLAVLKWDSIKPWLMSDWQVKVWIVLLVVLGTAAGFGALAWFIARRRYKPNERVFPDYWHKYRADVFDGMLWKWFYSNDIAETHLYTFFVDVRCFCVRCQRQLMFRTEESDKIQDCTYGVFYCERCHIDYCWRQGWPDGQIVDNIVKDIEAKIVSGDWIHGKDRVARLRLDAKYTIDNWHETRGRVDIARLKRGPGRSSG